MSWASWVSQIYVSLACRFSNCACNASNIHSQGTRSLPFHFSQKNLLWLCKSSWVSLFHPADSMTNENIFKLNEFSHTHILTRNILLLKRSHGLNVDLWIKHSWIIYYTKLTGKVLNFVWTPLITMFICGFVEYSFIYLSK